MTTKERILDTARVLFNSRGTGNTTVRTICEEMNISAGNFSYHYPSKDKIIEDLYFSMEKEMEEEMAKMKFGADTFLSYLEAHRMLFEIQMKYKFIYLNLFEIMVNYPNLKAGYLDSFNRDRITAKKLLKMYQENKVIKNDISDEYLEKALTLGHLLHNTWVIEAELSFKGNDRKKLKYYLEICCSLVEPYLTKKSLKEYEEYFSKL